jgi:hypothetical protein
MDNTLKGEFILNGEKKEEDKTEEAPKTTKAIQTQKNSALHFYSSFCPNPDGISFAEQEESEEILLLLRRHFVTNIPWLAAAFLLSLLPLLFPFFITFFPFPLPSGYTVSLYIAFYYLLIFGFLIINFTLWYFQAGLITNMRVIDVDLSGILYRQISEAKNSNIEDVTYNQIGFIRSLFNYGNVLVQTAGAEENIEYDRVPRPSKVADIIGDISQAA